MKRNTLIISIVSIISIFLMTGCRIKDRWVTYLGPKKVTCEKQVARYTKEYPSEIDILKVDYSIYDMEWNTIESGVLEYHPDNDYYAVEWAKVQRVKGEESDTVLVYLDKNETEHMREINVEMVPYELSTGIHVTQLPAGVEELPDR